MDAVRHFLHDWRLVLLVIHVAVTAAMIVVILLQRSEGGGLGMGRTDALFSVRGQANVLSRMTAIFACLFFFLSLLMAWSMTDPARASRSFMDRAPVGQGAPVAPTAPGAPASPGGMAPAPGAPAPTAPAAPTQPAAPAAPTR
jgi:preprotein translocase subunit SecG